MQRKLCAVFALLPLRPVADGFEPRGPSPGTRRRLCQCPRVIIAAACVPRRPDDASLWDKQVQHFRARYRCLRVTMPHFGGREQASARGDAEVSWEHCDWEPMARRLAAAVRAHMPVGKALTIVVHDWGAVWGFFLQLMFPELVKAMVAMDVGPPHAFAARPAPATPFVLPAAPRGESIVFQDNGMAATCMR